MSSIEITILSEIRHVVLLGQIDVVILSFQEKHLLAAMRWMFVAYAHLYLILLYRYKKMRIPYTQLFNYSSHGHKKAVDKSCALSLRSGTTPNTFLWCLTSLELRCAQSYYSKCSRLYDTLIEEEEYIVYLWGWGVCKHQHLLGSEHTDLIWCSSWFLHIVNIVFILVRTYKSRVTVILHEIKYMLL